MVDAAQNEHTSSTSFSRPFDVHRWSDYPELNDCLTELVQELVRYEGRQRNRGKEEAKRFRDAVRCLVLDLYVAWKTDPALEVGLSLRNGEYTRSSRYRALFIKWSSFKAAFVALEKAEYLLRTRKGFYDRRTGIGRVTRIRATQKLIELLVRKAKLTVPSIGLRTTEIETILLRDHSKRSLEYVDTAETLTMRANLLRINQHLQAHWIDIEITDAEFRKLQERMRSDYQNEDRERPFIDFGQRSLVRIFNNGDWQQGGRFYRGWWQSVPKEYRRFITIDGKRTSELDYSALHANLLYAQIGTKPDGDPYDLGGVHVDRDLVKKTFNAMINAAGRIKEPEDFGERSLGLTWIDLQSRIAAKHEPIKRFFNTGYGLQLQRLDSDLAEAVMLRFLDMRYVCLPVHDSFLVHHSLLDELEQVMKAEFKLITGQDIKTKEKSENDTPSDHRGESAEPLSMNLEEFFDPMGEYAGYEQRLQQFREYSSNSRNTT